MVTEIGGREWMRSSTEKWGPGWNLGKAQHQRCEQRKRTLQETELYTMKSKSRALGAEDRFKDVLLSG